MAYHVVHLLAQHSANGLVQPTTLPSAVAQLGVLLPRIVGKACKQRDFHQLLDGDQARAHAIIYIVCVIGDLIGQVGKLRLKRGLAAHQKPVAHAGWLTFL